MDITRLRGNSGGVAFGYNMPENITMPTIYISNSVFRNNSAIARKTFRTSSQTMAQLIYSGRGGAMAVYSNAFYHNISVYITDCEYEDNSARSFGGGLYIALAGKTDTGYYQNDFKIESTTFAGNTAGLGGGGVALFYPEIEIVDCTINSNSASSGGGIFMTNVFSRKEITHACI